MAVHIGGNLIWRLAVETKTHNLIPTNFYNIRRCVGVHVGVTIATCLAEQQWSRKMALFKYFLCDASSPKESSFLTEKEKDVVSEFAANAEK